MSADELEVELRLLRLEWALAGLAGWLVQAQSGLGERDVRALDDILAGKRDDEMLAAFHAKRLDS